jgi:hypothetical protein
MDSILGLAGKKSLVRFSLRCETENEYPQFLQITFQFAIGLVLSNTGSFPKFKGKALAVTAVSFQKFRNSDYVPELQPMPQ